MFKSRSSRRAAVATTYVAIVVTASTVLVAPAGAREQAARIQGARTGALVQRQTARSQGQSTTTRSMQGDLGRGATTTRNTTAADGVASVDSTTTLNNGQKIDKQGSLVDNGDGSASYDASRTGARGTASAAGTIAKTENGVTRTGTVTGAAGKSVTTSAATVRADDGVSRTQSVTNAQGQTVARQSDYSYAQGEGVSRSSTTTGPNGQSTSSSANVHVNPDGGVTRDSSITNAQGQQATRSATTTLDGNTLTNSATVTGPNGEQKTNERWISVYPAATK